MTVNSIQILWTEAFKEILEFEMDEKPLIVLSKQTIDSIRRIKIYETYLEKARQADQKSLPYYITNNPFILSQRDSLSIQTRVWIVYLATYFGKSLKSKWLLFIRSAFRKDRSLFLVEEIMEDRNSYFDYLRNINFFDSSSYSNHRKFTKKSLEGTKGFLHSADYFLNHIGYFAFFTDPNFHSVYTKAYRIPNFGRMAAFDFTSSLCKCGLGVKEPQSLYSSHSTGPLSALKSILSLAGSPKNEKSDQIELGENLLLWFEQNTNIRMCAQVIEDAICNWQKNTEVYKRYFG